MEGFVKDLLKEFTPDFLAKSRYKISVEKLLEGEEDILLLDVRSEEEVECMSIEEGLVHYPKIRYMHIPMNKLPESVDQLPSDREIFVFCRTTSRSAMVYAFLRVEGFKRVRLVDGGYVALLKKLVEQHGLF
jgi:rhodanese-related sulfurtransferase